MVIIKYNCAVCGSSFDSKESLSDHMVTAHATEEETTEEGEEKE